MKCKRCQSEDIISSSELSALICANCGYVISENFLKAENTFTEITKVGNQQYSSIISSVSQSLATISKLFSQIANQLNLPQSFIETGKRYYKCSINKHFTKGRSLTKVACVILYALCRINKTRHLLIDFSDASKINLYQLGVAYLRFVQLFQLNIPMSDPSLFIKRFCSKLSISNVDQVALTALRIVQCMNSQWITEGRNPCGICGAAIYIGLKYHGYNAILDDISSIVRVTPPIIRMRIDEFEQTPYSKMTKSEFDKGDFDHLNIMDPPSFSLNRNKDVDEDQINQIKRDKDTSSILSNREENGDIVTKASSFGTINLYESAINPHQQINDDNKEEEDKEEDISELNEEEKEDYIHTDKEYDLRKVIWEEKNKEWLEEQKEKEFRCLNKKRERNEQLSQVSKRKKEKNSNFNLNSLYTTPSDAILNTNKFQKMGLSESYIKNLFD